MRIIKRILTKYDLSAIFRKIQYTISTVFLIHLFYVDSRACVRVGNDVSEWFPVNDGLRHGCVISSWLFNVYMNCVVREGEC